MHFAVFSFWVNNDNWSDRWISKWKYSRPYWSERCMFLLSPFNLLIFLKLQNYLSLSFSFSFFWVFLPVSCWNCNAGNVVLIFIQLCRLACHGIWKGFLFSYFPSIISDYSRSLVPWITEYFTDSIDFKASTFLNTLSY